MLNAPHGGNQLFQKMMIQTPTSANDYLQYDIANSLANT